METVIATFMQAVPLACSWGPSNCLRHHLPPTPATNTRWTRCVLQIQRTANHPSSLSVLCPFPLSAPSLCLQDPLSLLRLSIYMSTCLPLPLLQVLILLISPVNLLYTSSIAWHIFSGVHLGQSCTPRGIIFHKRFTTFKLAEVTF
jgi:hypothetical protein